MTGDLSWSKATEADALTILSLMEEYYATDHLEFSHERAERALRPLLTDDKVGMAWLIRSQNDAVIGYVVMKNGYSLEYGGMYQFVDELFVKPEHRGRGVGTATLGFVEQQGRKAAVASIHMEVERLNSGANRLYRRLGYVDHGRTLLTKDLGS
jgi:GNAT superfamily N-acetyltransferase